MGLALIFLLLFSSDPIPKSDSEKQSVSVMDVNVEVVPGSLFMDHLSQNVRATSGDNSYQIGFKEFVLTYPSQTEIITDDGISSCSSENDCSSYTVTNIEKIDSNTGKVRIHYLIGDQKKSGSPSSGNRQTATIIYL